MNQKIPKWFKAFVHLGAPSAMHRVRKPKRASEQTSCYINRKADFIESI